MNDVTMLAYDLGDLMDSMAEFGTDSIYYTWDNWENKDGDVAELRFNCKTGKWSNNEIFEEFFNLGSCFPTMYKSDFEIVKKITQPEAYKLRDKMTKIVEAGNDN